VELTQTSHKILYFSKRADWRVPVSADSTAKHLQNFKNKKKYSTTTTTIL
jgi:hypothetical protein